MPPLLLALDTAFERCSAALLDPGSGAVLALDEPEIGKGHAERLIGVIDALLADGGATYRDLGKLGVTVGPGSFTGLRVGVSAARGFSMALGIPAIGITTLEALAAPFRGAPVLAVIDAKRGEVYAALFSADGETLAGPAALAPDGLPAFVAPANGATLALVGSGSALAAAILSGDNRIGQGNNHVSVAALARLAATREADGAPRPLYLRGADAKPPTRAPLFAP